MVLAGGGKQLIGKLLRLFSITKTYFPGEKLYQSLIPVAGENSSSPFPISFPFSPNVGEILYIGKIFVRVSA